MLRKEDGYITCILAIIARTDNDTARQLTTEKLNVRRCILTAIIFLVMIVSNYSSVGHRLYVGLGRAIDREITNKNVI